MPVSKQSRFFSTRYSFVLYAALCVLMTTPITFAQVCSGNAEESAECEGTMACPANPRNQICEKNNGGKRGIQGQTCTVYGEKVVASGVCCAERKCQATTVDGKPAKTQEQTAKETLGEAAKSDPTPQSDQSVKTNTQTGATQNPIAPTSNEGVLSPQTESLLEKYGYSPQAIETLERAATEQGADFFQEMLRDADAPGSIGIGEDGNLTPATRAQIDGMLKQYESLNPVTNPGSQAYPDNANRLGAQWNSDVFSAGNTFSEGGFSEQQSWLGRAYEAAVSGLQSMWEGVQSGWNSLTESASSLLSANESFPDFEAAPLTPVTSNSIPAAQYERGDMSAQEWESLKEQIKADATNITGLKATIALDMGDTLKIYDAREFGIQGEGQTNITAKYITSDPAMADRIAATLLQTDTVGPNLYGNTDVNGNTLAQVIGTELADGLKPQSAVEDWYNGLRQPKVEISSQYVSPQAPVEVEIASAQDVNLPQMPQSEPTPPESPQPTPTPPAPEPTPTPQPTPPAPEPEPSPQQQPERPETPPGNSQPPPQEPPPKEPEKQLAGLQPQPQQNQPEEAAKGPEGKELPNIPGQGQNQEEKKDITKTVFDFLKSLLDTSAWANLPRALGIESPSPTPIPEPRPQQGNQPSPTQPAPSPTPPKSEPTQPSPQPGQPQPSKPQEGNTQPSAQPPVKTSESVISNRDREAANVIAKAFAEYRNSGKSINDSAAAAYDFALAKGYGDTNAYKQLKSSLDATLANLGTNYALTVGTFANNPGNLKYSKGLLEKYPGILGPTAHTDQGDPQIFFRSAYDGMFAVAKLALLKYNNGKESVQKIIAAKGGFTPNNNYAPKAIAKRMGVDVNSDLAFNVPGRLESFLKEYIGQEQGNAVFAYPDSLIRTAANDARQQISNNVAPANPSRIVGKTTDSPQHPVEKAIKQAVGIADRTIGALFQGTPLDSLGPRGSPIRGADKKVSDIVRDACAAVGGGCRITSGYRSPASNKSAGGAKKSRHMQGDAIDVKVPVAKGVEFAKALQTALCQRNDCDGGLGYYGNNDNDEAVFHVDTRDSQQYWGDTFKAASVPNNKIGSIIRGARSIDKRLGSVMTALNSPSIPKAAQKAGTESGSTKSNVTPVPSRPVRVAANPPTVSPQISGVAGLPPGNTVLHYGELSVQQAKALGAATVIRPFGTSVAQLKAFEVEGIEAYKYVNPLNEGGPRCEGCLKPVAFRTGAEGLYDIKNPAFKKYLQSQVSGGVKKIFLDNGDSYGLEQVRTIVGMLQSMGVEKVILNNPNLISPESVTIPGVVAATFENTAKDATDATRYLQQIEEYRRQNPAVTAIILDDNGNTPRARSVRDAIERGVAQNVAISISSGKNFQGAPLPGAYSGSLPEPASPPRVVVEVQSPANPQPVADSNAGQGGSGENQAQPQASPTGQQDTKLAQQKIVQEQRKIQVALSDFGVDRIEDVPPAKINDSSAALSARVRLWNARQELARLQNDQKGLEKVNAERATESARLKNQFAEAKKYTPDTLSKEKRDLERALASILGDNWRTLKPEEIDATSYPLVVRHAWMTSIETDLKNTSVAQSQASPIVPVSNQGTDTNGGSLAKRLYDAVASNIKALQGGITEPVPPDASYQPDVPRNVPTPAIQKGSPDGNTNEPGKIPTVQPQRSPTVADVLKSIKDWWNNAPESGAGMPGQGAPRGGVSDSGGVGKGGGGTSNVPPTTSQSSNGTTDVPDYEGARIAETARTEPTSLLSPYISVFSEYAGKSEDDFDFNAAWDDLEFGTWGAEGFPGTGNPSTEIIQSGSTQGGGEMLAGTASGETQGGAAAGEGTSQQSGSAEKTSSSEQTTSQQSLRRTVEAMTRFGQGVWQSIKDFFSGSSQTGDVGSTVGGSVSGGSGGTDMGLEESGTQSGAQNGTQESSSGTGSDGSGGGDAERPLAPSTGDHDVKPPAAEKPATKPAPGPTTPPPINQPNTRDQSASRTDTGGAPSGGGTNGSTQTNSPPRGSSAQSSGGFQGIVQSLLSLLQKFFGAGSGQQNQNNGSASQGNNQGTSSSTTSVAQPIVILLSSSSTVPQYSSVRLSWSSVNTSSCVMSDGVSEIARGLNGSTTTKPLERTTTFTIECAATNATQTSDTVVVTVK